MSHDKYLSTTFSEAVDIWYYKKSEYSPRQLEELQLGLNKRLAIYEYANPSYSYVKMKQIRLGLERDVHIAPYISLDHSWLQMREIRLGKEFGVDVYAYSSSAFTWQEMRQIRLGLEFAVRGKFDMLFRFNEFWDDCIHAKIWSKCNRSKRKIDVTLYADTQFNWAQMRQLRIALQLGLDIFPMVSPKLAADQMKEITKGLMTGVDVYRYVNPENSACKMASIRLELEKQ